VKFMVTGGVLLAAVALDAVTRKRRRARGRA
jgi:ABC-type xylose transport system permease subunit